MQNNVKENINVMDMENFKREISVLKLKNIIHQIFGLSLAAVVDIEKERINKSESRSIAII